MATSFFMLGLVFPLLSFPSLGCYNLVPGLLIRSLDNSVLSFFSHPSRIYGCFWGVVLGVGMEGAFFFVTLCEGSTWTKESHLFLPILQLPFEMASLDHIFIFSHHYGFRMVSVMTVTSLRSSILERGCDHQWLLLGGPLRMVQCHQGV